MDSGYTITRPLDHRGKQEWWRSAGPEQNTWSRSPRQQPGRPPTPNAAYSNSGVADLDRLSAVSVGLERGCDRSPRRPTTVMSRDNQASKATISHFLVFSLTDIIEVGVRSGRPAYNAKPTRTRQPAQIDLISFPPGIAAASEHADSNDRFFPGAAPPPLLDPAVSGAVRWRPLGNPTSLTALGPARSRAPCRRP